MCSQIVDSLTTLLEFSEYNWCCDITYNVSTHREGGREGGKLVTQPSTLFETLSHGSSFLAAVIPVHCYNFSEKTLQDLTQYWIQYLFTLVPHSKRLSFSILSQLLALSDRSTVLFKVFPLRFLICFMPLFRFLCGNVCVNLGTESYLRDVRYKKESGN